MMDNTATVVLIPGLTCDRTFWAAQVGPLSRLAPVVIPRLADQRSIESMAQAALTGSTGPLHVVGHSMGGRVALAMYRQAPERISSLAILDTGAHPADANELARRQVRIDIARSGGMAALAADWVPNMVHPERVDDTELTVAISAMVTSHSLDQYEGQIHALLTRSDERQLLPKIRCRTLVACGSADAWSPVAQHEAIASEIGDARLEIIPDAGHMIAMERPAATTELLVDWLT